jgi:hypothetical protein
VADVLSIAGITFDGFSTPAAMGAGGKQAMVIHKLPGGGRIIDTLGPDEDNISWNGEFFSNDAYDKVLALDGVRAAGFPVPLLFGGQFRSVIIDSFSYKVRRLPMWVEYQISCVVYQNPSLGNVSATVSSVETLIVTDLSVAVALL